MTALFVKIATQPAKIVCFVVLGIADILKSKVMQVIVTLSSFLHPSLTRRHAGKDRKMKEAIGVQSYKLQYQDEQGKGIPSVLIIDG